VKRRNRANHTPHARLFVDAQPPGHVSFTYKELTESLRRKSRRLCAINGPEHLRKLMRADWLTAERRPGQRAVTGEAFHDPNWFKVGSHIWTRSKLHWVEIPSGVEHS